MTNVTQKSRGDHTLLTQFYYIPRMKQNVLSVMTLFFLILPEPWILADCGSRGYELSSYYQRVITSHYIRVEGAGNVDVSHEATMILFNHDDILDAVQRAYAHLLKKGEKPEFVVEQHGQGRWSYVNKSGNKSEIVELHRCAEANQPSMLVLYAQGDRFFGEFQAVIEIRFSAKTDSSCTYQVEVYAFPKSSVSRFLARRFGIAERYFRAKTADMIELSVRICSVLTEESAGPVLPL